MTATVDEVSLIAASIMSKKIAGGADAIVLDVKVGDGAFMKTLDDARTLANTMLALGREAGRETVCILTDMDQPLGHAVGNALEIREALATVRGGGPSDFTELVLSACGHLLAFSDLGVDEEEGRRRAEQAVADGSATDVWKRWIAAQGGRPGRGGASHGAGRVRGRRAASGLRWAAGSDCRRRRRAAPRRWTGVEGDEIDHAVGVVCHRKRGDLVEEDEVLAEVHARDEASAAAAFEEVLAAYEIADTAPAVHPLVLDVLA